MSSNNTAIQLTSISKRYEIYEKPHHRLIQGFLKNRKQLFTEFWALQNINLTIEKGETIGVIGKNGAGKSTLLQIICGTLTPTEGQLTVNGRVAALLELGAGFNPEFTGRENIFMYAALLGLSRQEVDSKLDDIIAFADIGTFLEQPVKTYSSGMFVRLAFSVIAHVDADILVIDEALAVGDVFFTQKCMRFLRTFQEKGTILFVSHDTSAVVNFCSKAVWIDKGSVRISGSPKEVTEKYLEGIYEINQEISGTEKASSSAKSSSQALPIVDQRLSVINNSNLRNDLEVFFMKEPKETFGTGLANILNTLITDTAGKQLSWVVGGEIVTILIETETHKNLENPIVGFVVKDKLGQTLFGDNTFLSYLENSISCHSGDTLITKFTFAMPILPAGAYSISVAIAEGSQEEHIQHHWVHDAVTFESHSSSLSTGLLGIPMHDISITTQTSQL